MANLALLIIANLAVVQTHTLLSVPVLLYCCQVRACVRACVLAHTWSITPQQRS